MKYLYLLFCLLLGVSLQAQIKIGDNPQTIDPSSVLELESSSRVLVITRVNTTEMNAITPSAGAMVYNTDIQCIHYYTGTEWKDICDAVAGSITFTSDDGTVVITPNGGNNYDIKVGQITGMNIVNETVFGADIATATIGERQLAPNSVGSSELQDNTVGKDEIQEAAVGTLEIIDGTIQPSDMQPGAFDQLLTTDAAGNVVWLNKSDLGATQADQTTITGAGTTTDPIKVADTVIGEILANTNSITVNTNNIAQNSNDIADINTALGTKEDLINKSDNIALGNSTTLYPTQNAVKTYVDGQLGTFSTDDDITAVTYSGTTLTVTEGTTSFSADLSILEESAAISAVQADVDANEAATNAALLLKEDLSNKDSNVLLGTSNTLYPTQNAVKTYVDNVVGGSAQTIVSTDAQNSITSGTDAGAFYVDGDDNDSNELTDIAFNTTTNILSLTNPATAPGGSVDLSSLAGAGADGVISLVELNGTDLDFTGSGGGFNGTINLSTIDTTLDETAVDAFVSNNGFLIAEVDGDVTNEKITASTLTGTTLTITEGGIDFDIDLSGLGGSQDLASVLTNGNSAGNLQINDLLDPTLDQDAATKKYVDDNIVAAGGGVPTDELITAFGLNTTALTITEDGVDWPVDLDAVFATDAELATAITASEALDLDIDDSNEIQVLSLTGNDLELSNGGGTVTLPGADGVVSAIAPSATGFDVTGANGGFNGSVDLDAIFATDAQLATAITASEALDLDIDDSNEIQVLSLTGNDLELSNGGGSVTLAISGSQVSPDFGAQSIITTGTLASGNTTVTGDLNVTNTVTVGVTLVHPDYVFQKYFLGKSELKESYDFQTLAQIEAFVKKHHHLPGIKSAEEVKQDGVWDIGASNLQNLEKIEELFLHTIEQEKKIDQLKNENESMSAELLSLRKDMDEIKALLKNKN